MCASVGLSASEALLDMLDEMRHVELHDWLSGVCQKMDERNNDRMIVRAAEINLSREKIHMHPRRSTYMCM